MIITITGRELRRRRESLSSEFATYELHQFRVGLADPPSSLAIS
jgi:hypothetical protein